MEEKIQEAPSRGVEVHSSGEFYLAKENGLEDEDVEKLNQVLNSSTAKTSVVATEKDISGQPEPDMLDSMNLPLRVVCATTKSQADFFSGTPTGMSLEKFSDVTEAEVILHTENRRGLSGLYNLAIEEARDYPCILVFIHDDVEISDCFWGERIRTGLKNFDIVGLAGNKSREAHQPNWYFKQIHVSELTPNNYHLELITDKEDNLSGKVGHAYSNGKKTLSVYGETGQRCKLIDGLLIAATSESLNRSNTRFDEQFAFHFYDMDFCRSAEIGGLTIGTIDLPVYHSSNGSYDINWLNIYQAYITKWGT